jgi:hypothetical protein
MGKLKVLLLTRTIRNLLTHFAQSTQPYCTVPLLIFCLCLSWLRVLFFLIVLLSSINFLGGNVLLCINLRSTTGIQINWLDLVDKLIACLFVHLLILKGNHRITFWDWVNIVLKSDYMLVFILIYDRILTWLYLDCFNFLFKRELW